MSAKTASLIAKILAVLILVGGLIGKGAFAWSVSVGDIIAIAITVAAVFATVDINILVDKLTKGQIDAAARQIDAAAAAVAGLTKGEGA